MIHPYTKAFMQCIDRKKSLHLRTELIRRRAKTNWQITSMLEVTVIAFYIIWTPYYATCINAFTIDKIPCSYFWFCINLCLLYPLINPVVYYIFNSNYRQGFREVLCCPWPCSNKCSDCFHLSTSPKGENNVDNAEQVNNAMENVGLEEHR